MQGLANYRDTVTIETLSEAHLGQSKRPLLVILGGVAILLFVACLNIANLLPARVLSQSAAPGQGRLHQQWFQ